MEPNVSRTASKPTPEGPQLACAVKVHSLGNGGGKYQQGDCAESRCYLSSHRCWSVNIAFILALPIAVHIVSYERVLSVVQQRYVVPLQNPIIRLLLHACDHNGPLWHMRELTTPVAVGWHRHDDGHTPLLAKPDIERT